MKKRLILTIVIILFIPIFVSAQNSKESLTDNNGKITYSNEINKQPFKVDIINFKCDIFGKNCLDYNKKVDILNVDGKYKTLVTDNLALGLESWYTTQVTTDKPLIQKNQWVWAYRVFDYRSCGKLGCIDYYKDNDIDFYGISSLDLDDNNETSGQVSYSYQEYGDIFDYAMLNIKYYSGAESDPTFSQSITPIAISGSATHNNTKFSKGDNSLSLNKSYTGDTILTESIDLGAIYNITNLSLTKYHDFSCSDNTIGLWRFEEGSGSSAYDECDYNNTGIINGATYLTEAKLGNYRLDFDGTNDYMNISSSASLDNIISEITISFWMNRDGGGTGTVFDTFVRKGITESFHVDVQRGNNRPRWIMRNCADTNWVVIQPTLALGRDVWHYIVATFNGSLMSLYYNGTLQGTAARTCDIISHNSQPIYVGSFDGTTRFLNGSMDSLTIINRSLNSSEIADLYNATKDNYINDYANVTAQIRLSNDNITFGGWQIFTPNIQNDSYLLSQDNKSGRFVQVKPIFNSLNSLISEYLTDFSIGYELLEGPVNIILNSENSQYAVGQFFNITATLSTSSNVTDANLTFTTPSSCYVINGQTNYTIGSLLTGSYVYTNRYECLTNGDKNFAVNVKYIFNNTNFNKNDEKTINIYGNNDEMSTAMILGLLGIGLIYCLLIFVSTRNSENNPALKLLFTAMSLASILVLSNYLLLLGNEQGLNDSFLTTLNLNWFIGIITTVVFSIYLMVLLFYWIFTWIVARKAKEVEELEY